MKVSTIAWSVFALLTLVPWEGLADDVMLEIGGGVESGLQNKNDMNFLLRVNVAGVSGTKQQLVYAHLNGDIAFAFQGPSASPYFDITFTPVLNLQSGRMLTKQQLLDGYGMEYLPIEVKRDLRVDEEVAVSVSLVGYQAGIARDVSEHVALFAQLAVDLVGYRYVNHVSDALSYSNVHLAGSEVKAGVLFNMDETYSVRLAVGGKGNINAGYDPHQPQVDVNVAQADYSAYAEMRVDFARYFELFAKASYNGSWDWNAPANADSESRYLELLGGLAVVY